MEKLQKQKLLQEHFFDTFWDKEALKKGDDSEDDKRDYTNEKVGGETQTQKLVHLIFLMVLYI